jgi:hypothetical protein
MLCDKCYGCQRQEDSKFKPPDDCIDYQDAYKDMAKDNVKIEYEQIKIEKG